ncbi:hypothetical protein [Moorena sp. SIO3I6]|uniref:hypothetical protein n=1 Tax=Moorena sp. SIO3I6 TaxID=2607831 RepID=UPI0013FB98BB|nr:hypothetical protein [Moorena sp. SIO3I6]NEP28079.1 hypothetical protein [Moorena sp. SIO3I6]
MVVCNGLSVVNLAILLELLPNYTSDTAYSLVPNPCSLLPAPYSLLPKLKL